MPDTTWAMDLTATVLTWTSNAPMPQGVYLGAVCASEDNSVIYKFGGKWSDTINPLFIDTVLSYNVASDIWSQVAGALMTQNVRCAPL